MNILLVEDNPADVRLIREMLKDIQALLNEKSTGTFANGLFNNNPN